MPARTDGFILTRGYEFVLTLSAGEESVLTSPKELVCCQTDTVSDRQAKDRSMSFSGGVPTGPSDLRHGGKDPGSMASVRSRSRYRN